MRLWKQCFKKIISINQKKNVFIEQMIFLSRKKNYNTFDGQIKAKWIVCEMLHQTELDNTQIE